MDSDPADSSPADGTRVSVERLRERTDELELIISGLTMVALFALPGWLSARYIENQAILPLGVFAAALVALPMVSTLAYTLGGCFLLHLLVRAYWVGLIGLSAVFPLGIRWERARHLGPLTRERLQGQVPTMAQAIARADRLASVLFALITLAALALLWLGIVGTLLFAGAAMVGNAIGATNEVIGKTAETAIALVLGAAILLWLLDAVLAARWPALQRSSLVRGLVKLLAAIVRVAIPERLIAPVRLTLQTNTHPRLFTVGFLVLVVAVPMVGVRVFQNQFVFDPYGAQRYMRAEEVAGGMRSPHYESLRTPQDRIRGWPMIPAPTIDSAWLPLFLPYVPLRDDIVLRQRCADLDPSFDAPPPRASDSAAVAARALAVADCQARMWAIKLDGVDVAPTGAHISERRDLGWRGLTLHVDLRKGAPGPRALEVTWRPRPEQDQRTDDYLTDSFVYRIDFLWSPEFAAAAEPAP